LGRHRVLSKPTAIVLSTLYAAFVTLFPWGLVQQLPFSDFVAYVDEFTNQVVSKREVLQLSGLKQFYSFELLWDELVRSLTRLTGNASVALRLISFFILFVWALFLFRRIQFGVALLFLFNPMAIDVAMSIIRNGLAWSVVLIGLSARSRAMRFTLFFIALFIHSSTLLLLIIYGLTHVATRVWRGRRLAVAGIGIGVILGLAVTVGARLVFELFGDRRFSEGYALGGGSLLQASMWGILLYLQYMSGGAYIKRNVFVIALLAWYETMNPFIPWSYRIWGALLPLIAVSLLDLPSRKRQVAFYCYSGYLALQWVYWTKLLNYWTWT
jgi:hypothetical protein